MKTVLEKTTTVVECDVTYEVSLAESDLVDLLREGLDDMQYSNGQPWDEAISEIHAELGM